ncbi:MAG: DUF2332 family protein [Acidimicrobiia bacterium]
MDVAFSARQVERCRVRGNVFFESNRIFSCAFAEGVSRALGADRSAANLVGGFLSIDGLLAWAHWNARSHRDRELAGNFGQATRPAGDAMWAGLAAGTRTMELLSQAAPRELAPFMSVVQRQDLARAAAVYSGLSAVAAVHPDAPLHLWEIGAGSGLLLYADRYRYSFSGRKVGAPDAAMFVDDFPVADPWLPIGGRMSVASRRGCDVQPLDPRDPDGRDRALSWLPPEDQPLITRIERALDFIAEQPDLTLEPVDAFDFVTQIGSSAAPGVHVIISSCVEQHWTEAERARFDALVGSLVLAAPANAPVGVVRVTATAQRRTLEVGAGREFPITEVAHMADGRWQASDVGRYLGQRSLGRA